jgi:hydroxymethylbilane synthase
LNIVDIRGNVPTRIRKALDKDGPYDAIVLAHAGLERLGLLDAAGQILPLALMLPAPGQGALGIQCRDDQPSLELLAPLNHLETRAAVAAERGFLSGLGGGCSVPIAAYANLDGGRLSLVGRVAALDGSRQIDVQISGGPSEALELGLQLASASLAEGAAELLGEGA